MTTKSQPFFSDGIDVGCPGHWIAQASQRIIAKLICTDKNNITHLEVL
jgi:hypothetical protein